MSLNKLLSILPPPNTPIDNGTEGMWEVVENKMGLKLPSDYKQYINTFGYGAILGFAWVVSPFSRSLMAIDRPDIKNGYQPLLDYLQLPYKFYPEPQGLLPCVVCEQLGNLMWITEGDPDNWKLIWLSHYLDNIVTFEFGLVDFLYEFIAGELREKLQISDDVLIKEKLFMTSNEFMEMVNARREWDIWKRAQ
jgi:hypothetical protein